MHGVNYGLGDWGNEVSLTEAVVSKTAGKSLRDGSMIELSLSPADNGQTSGLTSSPDVAASVLGRYQATRLKALHFKHIRQSKKKKRGGPSF